MTCALFNFNFYKGAQLELGLQKIGEEKEREGEEHTSCRKRSSGGNGEDRDPGRTLPCLTTSALRLVLKLLCFLSVDDFKE